jgi:DNA-binding winged helix-turn-helix (wHTH) protein/tetratricopeptide (TPR) repeat protein
MTAQSLERTTFAADFRVGDWLVEPSLDQISRNGHATRLRPQLIDLLVLLARHAGQTVPKEMILASVWAGQHVAESGLTRCIAEIRQALDDRADVPAVIQTIPKRGYRLVAPVMFLDQERTTPGGSRGTAAAPLPTDGLDTGLDPAGAAATGIARLRRLSRRVRWAVSLAAAAMFLVAVVWTGVVWSRVPELTVRDTVLLADVANTTGDRAFDGPLRLALAVSLEQAPFLRLLPDDHMRAAAVRAGRPAEAAVSGAVALDLCRREGAAALLAASIAPLGSHYAIGIEAVACGSGESLARELQEVPSKEGVLTAFGAAAARLRATLGESRASLREHDVPIVEATTSSLDALRAVTTGDENRDHARLDEALLDYRRATDLDPKFALAWARRGAVARNLGLDDEAVAAFRRAYELRERVSEPERLYILGHYYRTVADEPEQAVETYRTWQRAYPGSPVPPTNLASIAVSTYGRYADALPDAREAVRLAPYSSIALRGLVYAALGSNRVAEARQALAEAGRRGVEDAIWHDLAFQLAAAAGDEAAMRAQAQWAASRPAAGVAMTWNRALAAATAGRLGEARQLWSDAGAAAARLLPPIRQARARLWEAEAEALLGDPLRARAAAEAAVALHPQPRTMLDAAASLALAGDPGRAAALLADAVRRIEPGVCERPVWLFVSQALVAAKTNRMDQARARLAEIVRFERGRDWAFSPLGARATIDAAAGRPADAAAVYRQMLELRPVLPLSPWAAYARLGLARALGDGGDTAGSRAAYDGLLASMTTADADAPTLLAARRERAALPK